MFSSSLPRILIVLFLSVVLSTAMTVFHFVSAQSADSWTFRIANPVTTSYSKKGRVEVRRPTDSVFRQVCDDYSNNQVTAGHLCRWATNSEHTEGSWYSGSYGSSYTSGGYSSSSSYLIDDLRCPTSSSSTLSDCTYQTSSNCGSSEYLHLNCYSKAAGIDSGSYFLRMNYGSAQIVQTKLGTSGTWGTICASSASSGVYSTTSLRLCKFLGFTSLSSAYSTGSYSYRYSTASLSSLSCSSSATTLSSSSCSRVTTTSSCNSHSKRATSLRCGTYSYTPSSSSSSDDDDDSASLVGIIMGSVFGGIVFCAIFWSVVGSACDSSGCSCDCSCSCTSCCSCDSCCDCECSSCCDCGSDCNDSDCCCCCSKKKPSTTTKAATAGAAGGGAALVLAGGKAGKKGRASLIDSDESGSDVGGETEESIRLRTCPFCEKKLKSFDGRKSHIKAKHPEQDCNATCPAPATEMLPTEPSAPSATTFAPPTFNTGYSDGNPNNLQPMFVPGAYQIPNQQPIIQAQQVPPPAFGYSTTGYPGATAAVPTGPTDASSMPPPGVQWGAPQGSTI